jgi:hypothetical protein
MKVLGFIAFVLIAYGLYRFFLKSDAYLQKTFEYKILEQESYVVGAVGDTLFYIGYLWFNSALDKNGDILNGILLMIFGFALMVLLLLINMKQTNWYIGLVVTLFQLGVSAIIAFSFILMIFMTVAWFSETKPVYKIND